ncbi:MULTISPECIES: MFS transporter [Propionibacterium]|uniref:MFS transporter n=1 Tax=Propionibacterium TaxID=1743 RepID=UPI000543419E|nr:MFS transporter [Propionibacterium freudenreichii]AJQ90116.1 Polyol permease [Propionibacterium freudenreichii subsp. freudenreichii]MCT2977060.1 MFS transporter [Propionibacterium freudenreichii]MCT2977727.1 MFS transporter [Propionibacterium freudenreichii]MCT2981406.1 MFS transporter [Propionibacterium freudenreichii]MCT2984954.1 MFS transporter [Propionibacterium freudenreichii]
MTNAQQNTNSSPGLLERQGIQGSLKWGFLAVMIFMAGNSLELGFISPFLQDRGLSASQVSVMLTVYGAVVAVASWLSGALADSWRPRRVMLTGFVLWLIFEVIFLAGGVATGSYLVMIISYALRGVGYPLFAYGFLVWITMATPEERLGRATGWFWFSVALGQGVIAGYVPSLLIPVIGEVTTLWLSVAFVVVGGVMALLLLKPENTEGHEQRPSAAETIAGLARSATIVVHRPKIAIGGVVRIINQIAYFAFPAFFSYYMIKSVGFTTSNWQIVWAALNLANVFASLVMGYVGDKIGRIRTTAWIGGLGCAITVFAMYYGSVLFGTNMLAAIVPAMLFGITLGAYVPLSAIVPTLAPDQKGSAVAILNLGAGLSNFAGPLVVTLFLGSVGVAGVVWILVGLYVVSFVLTFFLRPSKKQAQAEGAAA